MAVETAQRLTPEEYLERERRAEFKASTATANCWRWPEHRATTTA